MYGNREVKQGITRLILSNLHEFQSKSAIELTAQIICKIVASLSCSSRFAYTRAHFVYICMYCNVIARQRKREKTIAHTQYNWHSLSLERLYYLELDARARLTNILTKLACASNRSAKRKREREKRNVQQQMCTYATFQWIFRNKRAKQLLDNSAPMIRSIPLRSVPIRYQYNDSNSIHVSAARLRRCEMLL